MKTFRQPDEAQIRPGGRWRSQTRTVRAALFALRHREAPDRLRGRIFTTGASVKITGFALDAAAAGPAAAWSLPGALALASSVAALAVAVVPRRSGNARTAAR